MKSLGLKFIVASGKVIIGTPEGVSFMEEKYLQDNYTALVEGLVPGKYLVNLYFLYHDEPIELEKQEYADRLKIDPDFDKNGHIIVFKKVSDDYNFPEIKELPQLG